jgi:hypothetical protein
MSNTAIEDVKAPKWLKRIQENSWEGEILISGGAIFTLLQLSDFLVYIKTMLSENLPLFGLDEVIIFSMVMLKWVTLSFAFHLILRGYWVALLCVNSAFPAGINTKDLKLSWKYRDELSQDVLADRLVRLDKICGLVFYSAFAFVMFIAGVVTTSAFFAFGASRIPGASWVLLILLIIFYVDLLTFGLLRRNVRMGKIYYPVYLFFNWITLTFLYRKALQIIFTNIRRMPAIIYLIVSIVVSLSLSYLSLYKPLNLNDPFNDRLFAATITESAEQASDQAYLDKIDEAENIRWYAIESEISDHDYLKIFINYRASYDEGISVANADAFEKIVEVKIDDRILSNLSWTSYRRPDANQYGIVSMLPVSELAKGKHLVSVHIADEYFTSKPIANFKIPFWRE